MKIILLSILILPFLAFGADANKKIEEMDSMLDRLERKLMDQEASSLHIQPMKGPKASKSMSLSAKTISGSLPQDGDFTALEKQIIRLEKEADELSGQIETLKSDFMDKATQGNLIELSAGMEDPDRTAIRELHLTLDKTKIYSVSTGDVPWMPGKHVPLFLGPLEAGEHVLRLEARTVRRPDKGLPLDLNTYHRYEQEFKIKVPPGNAHLGYRLLIQKPEQQNTRAQAKLETYDLP
jgi:hypothetical protein